MTRAPNWNFARVWYAQSAMVAVALLPLEYLGWVPGWAAAMTALVTLGLGWFGSAEWAAEVTNDTPQSDSGTYTSFIFYKITNRWARVAYGILIGLVLFWRLPDIWYFDDAIWFFFQTWLPYHYWSPGIRGPWEWLGAFIFRR